MMTMLDLVIMMTDSLTELMVSIIDITMLASMPRTGVTMLLRMRL